MNNLFLSFLIAIAVAAGLVFLSRSLHLEFNTSNIFPLIPIFYALVYELLERITTGKEKPAHPAKAKAEMKAGMAQIFQHITVGRIFTAIGVGLLIKILFEIIFLVVYSQFDYITFKNIYGVPSVETIGKLIKGDDVLEKIATTQTLPGDRPVKRMNVESVKIVPADSVK